MLRPWAPEFAATGDGLRRSLNGLIRSALGRFELEHSWNVEFATSVNVGVQAQSSCKFVRLVFPNTMRSSTSIDQANGLSCSVFVVWISVAIVAQLWPPLSAPANKAFLRYVHVSITARTDGSLQPICRYRRLYRLRHEFIRPCPPCPGAAVAC
jgi:hypothetical protein